jgi:hypothetical protein
LTRKSYQTAYSLGQHGTGQPGTLKDVPVANSRSYAKGSTPKMKADGKWNIDYGETIRGGQLEDYT